MWDMIREQVRNKQFKLGATLPIAWKVSSFSLKHAADKLYDVYDAAENRILQRLVDEIESGQSQDDTRELEGEELLDHHDTHLFSVYCLLLGYAIENLLKGILMVQHPEYFKPNKKMTDIRSHNLVRLCNRCNIPVDKNETALLDTLTTYVEWQGKYPIPLSIDDMPPKKQPDGTWEEQGWSTNSIKKLREDADKLYTKIYQVLDRLKR
jgi:hypothetical protein